MKKYIKNINGQSVIKQLSDIIVYKNGKQIINPQESMVIEDGWVKYDTPISTNILSDEELLENERQRLIRDIQLYDKSDNVETFYINNTPIWLDREERMVLQRRFEIEKKNNINTSILWKNGLGFSFNIDDAIKLFEVVELYAIQSYDNTQNHIFNVKKLSNIDDIKSYDYRIGYPDKIRIY